MTLWPVLQFLRFLSQTCTKEKPDERGEERRKRGRGVEKREREKERWVRKAGGKA